MKDEGLLVSTSNRNLERKIKIFGFEIFDLLILGIVLAILNLIFKSTSLQMPIVWGGTLIFGLVLYFTKKNKPENYLLYKLQYWFRPATYYASSFDLQQKPYLKGMYENNQI